MATPEPVDLTEFDETTEAIEHSIRQADSTHLRNTRLQGEVKRLRSRVAELESELELLRSLPEGVELPEWAASTTVTSRWSATPVLMLSDLHFGATVEAAEVDGINAFDDDIALARWERVVSQTVEATRRHLHGYGIETLVAALLGDLLQGLIHEEYLATNSHTVPVSIELWVPRLASGLCHIADELGCRILAPAVDGNHDRYGKPKPSAQRHTSSFAWIMYAWLRDLLRAQGRDDIEVVFSPSSQVRFPVGDMWMLAVHGDEAMRSSSAGGGIGGIWPIIKRYVTKVRQNQSDVGKPVDMVLMGHFHQLVWSKDFVINGSLIGYDAFARGRQFAPERPQQALMAVAPERGVILQVPIHAE